MKILILGATGMLGYQLFKQCLHRGMDVSATIRSKNKLPSKVYREHNEKLFHYADAKDSQALLQIVNKITPDVVINCIGIIKQSELAKQHLESIAVNALFPHQVQKIGLEQNFRLIHISTDCVFSGDKGYYKENEPSDAEDLYGKTKFLGEVKGSNAVTLRTSIIGHELSRPAFGLIEWFLSQTKSTYGYKNAFFSGLTTVELSKVILDTVLPSNLSGLFQVASDPISKFDLLELVSRVYKKDIEIIPDYKVNINRSLDGSNFEELTDYKTPSWPVMVEEMYKDFKNTYES